MQFAQSLLKVQPSYIREILKAASSPDVISLAGGLPCPDLFPMDLLSDFSSSLSEKKQLFQYGETQGYQPLISHFYQRYPLPDRQIGLVTNGAQQGLDLIARAFIEPGDNIVMEAPSYLGALQVFGLAQANIHSVQQVANGPDLNQLESLFAKHNIKLFYAVPDFHNPTGLCWPLETRQKVAALCLRNNVGLVEDAPYRELRFSGKSLPLVSSFCPDQALVLRSFSKIATPGIRLGWVTGPTLWIKGLIKVKQAADLHSNLPLQGLLLALLEHHNFANHLKNIKTAYLHKYQHLSRALTTCLPHGYDFSPVSGGMFLWLRIPNCDVEALAHKAINNGVAVVPSSVFYAHGQEYTSALRLNFSHANEDNLSFAVNRLAEIFVA